MRGLRSAHRCCAIMVALIATAGCASSDGGERSGERSVSPRGNGHLIVRFTDERWTHGSVPDVGRCRECGGQGFSPPLRVSNVPAGANRLVIAFRDITAHELGGISNHGALSMETNGADEISVPSVDERTATLPASVAIAQNHGTRHRPAIGYLAPCACEGDHRYEVQVRAVSQGSEPGSDEQVLARGRLVLGTCCVY